MIRIRLLLIVLAALVFGGGFAPAMAQSDAPFPAIAELPGVVASINRDHALDFSQFDAEGSSTPAEIRDALFFGAVVVEFDTPENAANGYQVMVEGGAAPLAATFGMETPEVVEVPLDDLGDQALAFSIFNNTGSSEGYLRQVVMQQANYVFVTLIVTEAEDSSLDADALIAYFSEQVGAAPTGVGTYDAEGGSIGGLWDFFPPADHELFAGLALEGDAVIFPELGG